MYSAVHQSFGHVSMSQILLQIRCMMVAPFSPAAAISSSSTEASPGALPLFAFFVALATSQRRVAGSCSSPISPSLVSIGTTLVSTRCKLLVYSSHISLTFSSPVNTLSYFALILPALGENSPLGSLTCSKSPLLLFRLACSSRFLHLPSIYVFLSSLHAFFALLFSLLHVSDRLPRGIAFLPCSTYLSVSSQIHNFFLSFLFFGDVSASCL